jgi:hypothetical protein
MSEASWNSSRAKHIDLYNTQKDGVTQLDILTMDKEMWMGRTYGWTPGYESPPKRKARLQFFTTKTSKNHKQKSSLTSLPLYMKYTTVLLFCVFVVLVQSALSVQHLTPSQMDEGVFLMNKLAQVANTKASCKVCSFSMITTYLGVIVFLTLYTIVLWWDQEWNMSYSCKWDHQDCLHHSAYWVWCCCLSSCWSACKLYIYIYTHMCLCEGWCIVM